MGESADPKMSGNVQFDRPGTGGVPGPWRHHSRGSVGGMAIYGVLSAAMAGFAVVAVLQHMVWGVAAAVLMAWGFACEATSWMLSTRPRSWRSDPSAVRLVAHTLEIKRDARVVKLDILSSALTGTGALVFGVGFINGWISILTITPARGWYFAGVGLVLGPVFLRRALSMSLREKPFMRMTADGFEVVEKRCWYDWRELSRCAAVPMKGDRRGGAWLAVLPTYSERPAEFRVDESGLGAPVTLRLLDFYRRHPGLRDELSDGRVLHRIREVSLFG